MFKSIMKARDYSTVLFGKVIVKTWNRHVIMINFVALLL